MRFCANVSLLFREVPFLERFEFAARSGLDAVEFWWPRGEDLAAVAAAIEDSCVRVAMFNFDGGDMAAGDRGLLSDPARHDAFRRNVPLARSPSDGNSFDIGRRMGVSASGTWRVYAAVGP